MTKTTPNQATSTGGQLIDKTYVVRSRPLKVDDALRQPGDLIPEARDWSYKLRSIYIDQGLIEEVNLITDDARQAFQRQWDQERQARFEAAKMAPKPDTYQLSEAKMPAPSLTLTCANCRKSHGFDHPVGDAEWWECSQCGQRQVGEQSRRGTLQMVNMPAGSHAVGHNWKPPTWRQD